MPMSLPHLVDIRDDVAGVPGAVRIHNLMCNVYPQVGKVNAVGLEDQGPMWTHVLLSLAGVDIRARCSVHAGFVNTTPGSDWIELPIGSGQFYRPVLLTRPFYAQPNEYTKVFISQLAQLVAAAKWLGP